MRILSAIACAALAPLFIAAAPEPLCLKPSSPWVVDYGENSCRLFRTFGQGDTQTRFVMESPAPDEMDMLITGKPLATFQEQVPARFLPVGGEMFEGNVAQVVTNKVPAILWASTIRMLPDSVIEREENEAKQRRPKAGQRPPPTDLAKQQQLKLERERFLTAATALEIHPRRDRIVILETGSLGAPIKAFDQCGRYLAKSWGVDPDIEDKIVRHVWTLNLNSWLSSSDYPQSMLARGKGSEVSVRLLIDAKGKVTKCTSLSHFDEPEFNKISCDLISKRARFAPAELADGTKVPSYMSQRIIFRIW